MREYWEDLGVFWVAPRMSVSFLEVPENLEARNPETVRSLARRTAGGVRSPRAGYIPPLCCRELPQRQGRRPVLPRAALNSSAIALSVFRHARLPTISPVRLERTRATRNPGVVYRTFTTLFESGEFVPLLLTYFEHTYQYSHVYFSPSFSPKHRVLQWC